MLILMLTLTVFALVMGAMAIGVMLTGRKLRGSCGGTSDGGSDCACDAAKRRECSRKAKQRSAPTGRSLEVLPE